MIVALEPQLVSPRFLTALAAIESSGDPKAVGQAGELGIYQLLPICVRDCNRIMGREQWSLDDRLDPQESRIMARLYLTYWGEHFQSQGYSIGPEQLLAIFRWGPSWRPWNEVRIDRLRSLKLHKILDSF